MDSKRKYEIAVLAEAAELAQIKVELIAQQNMPTTTADRVEARIQLEIARAELDEAKRRLSRAHSLDYG